MVITQKGNLERLPSYDGTSRLAITADVRLDNREDLSTTFGLSSAELTHTTDSTLILMAYQKWGDACPRHLLGDFAFAIWNAAEHTLFCARDHIGAKPFYYCLTPQRFIFASDINGVLAVPSLSHQLNEMYIATHLQTLHFQHIEEHSWWSPTHP
jgi:asparagine synthase (glutamine-hydrolysing)